MLDLSPSDSLPMSPITSSILERERPDCLDVDGFGLDALGLVALDGRPDLDVDALGLVALDGRPDLDVDGLCLDVDGLGLDDRLDDLGLENDKSMSSSERPFISIIIFSIFFSFGVSSLFKSFPMDALGLRLGDDLGIIGYSYPTGLVGT